MSNGIWKLVGEREGWECRAGWDGMNGRVKGTRAREGWFEGVWIG